jgi:predicted amidohydrolase
MVSTGIVLVLAFTFPGWVSDPSKPRIAVVQAVADSIPADVAALVDQAGTEGADLVLLPMAAAGMTPQTTAGSMFQTLSVLAKKHDMDIIAPIRESWNGTAFNTAMVIDSNGDLAGIYRQAHVSSEDRLSGVSDGNELPVFETRFGKIGVLLGYDLLFREAPRIIALRGAKLLLYASSGDSNEAGTGIRLGEAAFFDGYYVAMAGVAGSGTKWASNILGLDGRPLAIAGQGPCVVSAIVDLQSMTPVCFQQGSRDKLFACRDPYQAELGTELMLTNVDLALRSDLQALRQQLRDNRRPELYSSLIQSDTCLPESEVKWSMSGLVGGAGGSALITAATYNAMFPAEAEYTLRLSADGRTQESRRITYKRWDSTVQGCGWDFGYRFLPSTFEWTATPGAHVTVPDTATVTPSPGG